ncbi:MAG: PAS domain S-box protein [Candidatus Competibacteraceae bacterium]|nr:PAS domain S-box protein [Candidatus Competibacteraceae bacterium]
MRRSLFLTLLYTAVASLWLFGLDRLMLWPGSGPGINMALQAIKDWGLLAGTALLIFFLPRVLEAEKRLERRLALPSRAGRMPAALFLLLAAAILIPVSGAIYEALRQVGKTTSPAQLLAWFTFSLALASIAGAAAILFWRRNAKARALLERLSNDLERAALRHRFEALLRQSLDVVVLLAEDGTIIEVNDRVRDYYGRAPEQLRGQHVRELRCPSCRELLADDYDRVARTGGAVFERLHLREDGTAFPVEISARAISDQEHRYFQSVVRDISERKRAEAALAVQVLRFRATFEQAAVGMAHVAPDGRWLLVNDCFCQLLGYSRSELLTKTFQAITHPDDLEKDAWVLEQLLADHIQTYSMEKRYFHRDGATVWVNLTVSLLRNAEGRPEYFIVVIDDITPRKRIERRLARISRFYAALNLTNQILLRSNLTAEQLFEEVCRIAVKWGELKGAWIGLLDSATHQLRVVAAFGELRGRLASLGEPIAEGAELPYRPARQVLSDGAHSLDNDLLHGQTEDAGWQILMATTGVRSCAAFPLKRAGAVIGAFSLYASEPEFFDPELVELLDGMAADVSFALDNLDREEHRQGAERALRESEARYRALFEAHPMPMWVYDTATLRFLAVNDSAILNYGYTREQFLGMTIAAIRPRTELRRLRQQVARSREGSSRSGPWKHCRRDGTLLEVDVVSHPITWGDSRARVVLVRRLSEQLQPTRPKLPLGALCERNDAGILISDRQNKIVSVNRAFTEMTGYDLAEIRGANPRILSSGRHDHQFFRVMWTSLGEVGNWQGAIWNRRKNGEIYPEWLKITALRDDKNQISCYVAIFEELSERGVKEDRQSARKSAH